MPFKDILVPTWLLCNRLGLEVSGCRDIYYFLSKPREREKMTAKELTIEELTTEAMKLLTIGIEELYVVLGYQLLGSSRPARVAGIISYQTALKKVIETQHMYEALSFGTNLAEWGRGFELMYEELKQDGTRFLDSVRDDLRNGLCNEEILALADEITASTMQIIVLIVAAILRMPMQIESVSATVAAILCKLGLKNFCR
jgi:hypothetical protein